MPRIYTESDVRFCISVVEYFGRQFGAENCHYELFDAGHQIGVATRFPDLEARGGETKWRHAERVKVGDEKDLSEKLNAMLSWAIEQRSKP
jgi:hypothetical protein